MRLVTARYLYPVAGPLLEDGALLIAGDTIIALGRRRELAAAHPRATVVDLGESVLLPPLVNAHTHLELSDFPAWAAAQGDAAEPADFIAWIERLVRVRRGVDAEQRRASLAAGLARSLTCGTGAVGDILTSFDAASAYAATPLAGVVFTEVLGHDPQSVAQRLSDCLALVRRPPAPRLAWGLSPHAPYSLNAGTLALALAFAREQGLPTAMHWAESAEEAVFLSDGGGPVAARLYPAAGWSVPESASARVSTPPAGGGLLIHGAQLTVAQLPAIAAGGHHLVLCPRSNSRFGPARAPVAACRRAGVPLALGTDSLASSPSLSLWGELSFARQWFAGALDPQEWLKIATYGGAAALGLERRLGPLRPGGDASFQAVALPAGASAATLAEALCAGGEELAVRALWLAGENVLPASRAASII